MENAYSEHDVVVMGGGLAGLTLALQLKQREPALDVLVLERRIPPAPEAIHKVGESSVEIGAHYFSEVLGLKDHLQEQHLRKFGFRFFFSEGRRDLDQVTEIGASTHLSMPSYQIDRGIFENFLAEEAQARGIRVQTGAMVRQIELSEDSPTGQVPHEVTYSQAEATHTAKARWVVDACGRAGLIKRKLDLAETNDHACHAVWFRIKDRIKIDEWSDNTAWREQCDPQARWLSTNHLMGAGYWVWLIPLSSGSHSIGIVADPALHPIDRMDSFDKAMSWLAEFQPLLFDELDPKRHLLQDFAFFKRFSYGCKQVFSANRWALTGEAGLFLDPFYSPGSDFIAIGNTYITELISLDRQGQRLGARAAIFDQVFHSFYENTLTMYQDQYPLFGDPEVLPIKVIWDYTYYWGVLAQFFFHNRLTDLSSLAALRSELAHCQQLNLNMQTFLREWSKVSAKRNHPIMLDQAKMPWFAELNRSLNDTLDAPAFLQRIRDANTQLSRLAEEVVQRAHADHPDLPAFDCSPLIRTSQTSSADAEPMATEKAMPMLHKALAEA
jgi:flavin-dependent dehydrogenase